MYLRKVLAQFSRQVDNMVVTMRSHNLFIVPMIASWFLLALLAPAEAGFMSWVSGEGWKSPTGNGKAGGDPDNAISSVTNIQIPNAGSAPNSAFWPVVINEDIKDATPNLNPALSPVVTSPDGIYDGIASDLAFEPLVVNEDVTDAVSAFNSAIGPAVMNENIKEATPNLNPAPSPVVTSPQATPYLKPEIPAVTTPEDIYVMRTQIIDGSVYQVTIKKQIQYGLCVDKVKIELQGSKLEKTLEFKCSGSRMRRVLSNDDLLLIENPDKDFCIFTTNKNELYYLQDGKWKKGDFSGDNTKDKELTPSEITVVKERINKWQAFYEKYLKEIERIMNLKIAERDRFQDERARIWNEREKERQSHFTNAYVINQLKTEESNKHKLERKKISSILEKEGWSDAIEQLQSAEYERQLKTYAEIEELKDKEDKRFETTLNDFETKVSVAESKSEEEIKRLESLEAEEEKRALQELKENIKQGW